MAGISISELGSSQPCAPSAAVLLNSVQFLESSPSQQFKPTTEASKPPKFGGFDPNKYGKPPRKANNSWNLAAQGGSVKSQTVPMGGGEQVEEGAMAQIRDAPKNRTNKLQERDALAWFRSLSAEEQSKALEMQAQTILTKKVDTNRGHNCSDTSRDTFYHSI